MFNNSNFRQPNNITFSDLLQDFKLLGDFIVHGKLQSVSKDKSLTNFNKAMIKGTQPKSSKLPEDVSAFMGIHAFTLALNRIWGTSETEPGTQTITEDDRDILAYIGGSMINSLKKKYKSGSKYESLNILTCSSTDEQCASQKMTKGQDRGRLIYITKSFQRKNQRTCCVQEN